MTRAPASDEIVPLLERLALAAGLSREAAHAQLASALDVVVHLDRRAGSRQVREFAVVGRDRSEVVIEPAVTFGLDGAITEGPGLSRLTALLEE